MHFEIALALIAGYIVGAVPLGLLASKAAGVWTCLIFSVRVAFSLALAEGGLSL